MKQNTILIVDDVEINRMMLAEIFKDDYDIIEAENGKEAIKKLVNNYKSVAMILLDVIMPEMDGYQVMDLLKEKNILSKVPIILITGDTSEKVMRKAYDVGVADIIHKPFDSYIVKRRVLNIIELYQHKNNMERLIGIQTNQLKEQNNLLQQQAKKLVEINDAIIDTMSTVVEFRNLESGKHIIRIKKFSACLARAMMEMYPELGVDEKQVELIEKASAMHDIGKIAIPDSILLKPGKLTNEEFEVMKSHTTKGCEIINTIEEFQGKDYYDMCYQICRYHHERFDGRGYPEGLKGEEIPLCAQIVSVADVYDALVSKRVYKSAYEKEKAYEMIKNGECGIFSPYLMTCLTKIKSQFEQIAKENEETYE